MSAIARGEAGFFWELPLSAAMHVLVFATVMVVRCQGEPSPPPFKPQEVMMVEMSGLPRQETPMPQKAERAPPPAAGAPEAPAPIEPPPTRQSDMVLKTPDAPKQKGNPEEDAKREQLIAEMRRRALIENLDAPIGTEDRMATDPNSTLSPEEAFGSSAGTPTDPAVARWSAQVQKLVRANWHPLLSICQQTPSLSVTVKVPLNAAGAMTGEPEIDKSSGNGSIDESARRAVQQTGNLPAPPENCAACLNAGLRFNCKDVL